MTRVKYSGVLIVRNNEYELGILVASSIEVSFQSTVGNLNSLLFFFFPKKAHSELFSSPLLPLACVLETVEFSTFDDFLGSVGCPMSYEIH